mgnify:CR=1 FL=1
MVDNSIFNEFYEVPGFSNSQSARLKRGLEKMKELLDDSEKLKANVAIESGKSARTVDRDIKAMIDVQDFAIEKNTLAKAWTS